MPCSSREKIQTQQTYFDISVSHKRKLRHCSSCKKNALMHIGIYRRMFLFSKYSRMLDADKAHNCLQATFITVLVCNVPTIPAACSPQEWRTSSLPGKIVQTTLLIFHEDWCALHRLQFQPSIFSGVYEREYKHRSITTVMAKYVFLPAFRSIQLCFHLQLPSPGRKPSFPECPIKTGIVIHTFVNVNEPSIDR